MLRLFLISTIVLTSLFMATSLVRAQTASGQQAGPAKDRKVAPAPRHDISGTWDPGDVGIQPFGSRAMPDDGKPEHQLPFTPSGLEILNTRKPGNGIRSVLPGEINDPVVYCDPQ